MAKFRPTSAPTNRSQPSPPSRWSRVAPKREAEQDAWRMAYRGEPGQELMTQTSIQQSEVQGDSTLPTLRVVPDGIAAAGGPKLQQSQQHPVFICQPLAGFEYCYPEQHSARVVGSLETPASRELPAAQHHLASENQPTCPSSSSDPGTPGQRSDRPESSKRKYLKRSHSVAIAESSKKVKDNGEGTKCVKVVAEVSSTFYIGDFSRVVDFLFHRFDELTTKPLRTMVTTWIKILEPRRQSDYGPYHKQLASMQPPQCTPPWWPADVPYNEPSHLSKHDLNALAVDIMLQHREIDRVKRECSWISKLRKAAEYAVETTPVQFFSSSRNISFNTKMRQRAMTSLLPSLFDVAQSYEDHVIKYALYEGSESTDPGTGAQHTWKVISKPSREMIQKRPVHKGHKRQNATARGHTEQPQEDVVSSDSIRSIDSRQICVMTPKQPQLPTSYETFESFTSINILGSSTHHLAKDTGVDHSLHAEIKADAYAQLPSKILMHGNDSPSLSLQHSESPSDLTCSAFKTENNSSSYTGSPSSVASTLSSIDPSSHLMLSTPYSSHISAPTYGPSTFLEMPYLFDGYFYPIPVSTHSMRSTHDFTNYSGV